eukprot:c24899_g1_i3 orf=159-1286(-)
MIRYKLKKGFQAALRLQEKLCTRRSPYVAGRAEEIIAKKDAHRTKDTFSTVREALFSGKTSKEAPPICRGSTPTISSLLRSSLLRGSDPFPQAFRGSRFYYTGSHFQRDGFHRRQWSTQQYVLIAVATTGLCASVYFSNREVVPYTYRKHFVLIPPDYEMLMVERQFKSLKEEWKHLILPPFHPQSIRVRRIAKDVIKAVFEGIQHEDSSATQLEHGDEVHIPKKGDTGVLVWRENIDSPGTAQWGSKEEVMDDQWMNKSRKKGLKQGSKPFVEHLKKMKWEVLVVDKDVVNAFCLPGGKIVVFTGLLKRFPRDEEIATVLGHEVSHVVARHGAERMTRHLYVILIQLFLLAFFNAPDIVQSFSILFLELPFSRR